MQIQVFGMPGLVSGIMMDFPWMEQIFICASSIPDPSLMVDLEQQVWQSPCFHGNRVLVVADRQYMCKPIHFFFKLGSYKVMC